MSKTFASLLLACVFALSVFISPVSAQQKHEYAPLEEKTFTYRDWTFPRLGDNTPVNLRQFAAGKKLVLVVYYAPWCPNWQYEAPVVAKLYNKYKSQGFDVIAVNEYAPTADSQKFFGSNGAPYTVVVESVGGNARDTSTHAGYRKLTGDARKWGSPYNIFLEPARLTASGDVLTESAWVVQGELIEKDAERFIRARLGLK
ncbi:MAG: TlpA family protein disulfide reductase [Pyrinomonadaceae bacterium]|jgi:thiol-disulfide isomerase/thioredoxin|nr:TlpA family protein disulfide reductase [Pyrinomonadaceae bacterium]